MAKIAQTLNKQEKDFYELFIFGCDPYAGNARKCYEDVFSDNTKSVSYTHLDVYKRQCWCSTIPLTGPESMVFWLDADVVLPEGA